MKTKKSTNTATLDLHGRTTDEVYDLVDRFITESQRRGLGRVRIMPGKGSGRVKTVLLDYLKRGHYPWQFEVNSSQQKNEGVLIVFLE